MLIPIKHENMTARRWPVVTLALIAIKAAISGGGAIAAAEQLFSRRC